MEDWAFNVLKGNPLDESFPVAAEASHENAEMLSSENRVHSHGDSEVQGRMNAHSPGASARA
jgi:hypothetical protein